MLVFLEIEILTGKEDMNVDYALCYCYVFTCRILIMLTLNYISVIRKRVRLCLIQFCRIQLERVKGLWKRSFERLASGFLIKPKAHPLALLVYLFYWRYFVHLITSCGRVCGLYFIMFLTTLICWID